MDRARVRFAPSPTGYLHIGGLRTLLYNYLFAKHNDGDLLLRIEDTDRDRLVPGAVEGLIKAIDWSGITYDEGVYLDEDENIYQKGDKGSYIQSERLDIYQKYVNQLLESGDAYYCFCTRERLDDLREQQRLEGQVPKYDGLCRGVSREEAQERIANGEEYVIRLKMPKDTQLEFDDMVFGKISFNSDDQDDQVLLKSDGYPTYHMAVVVDDHLMEISHIIRGEEWISSTPKHVLLYQALGWEAPVFAHLPSVLNKERKKLSKREGDVAVEDFRASGYLPEGIVNYIALVGWSPSTTQEILSMEELIEDFDFSRVSRSGGVFDTKKLDWVNHHYMKDLPIDELFELSEPFVEDSGLATREYMEEHRDWFEFLLETIQDSVDHLGQIPAAIEFAFKGYPEDPAEGAIEILQGEEVPVLIQAMEEILADIDELDKETAAGFMKQVQQKTGLKGKNLFMPSRVAMTGVQSGPELGNIIYLLGKDNLKDNLEKAKSFIK